MSNFKKFEEKLPSKKKLKKIKDKNYDQKL